MRVVHDPSSRNDISPGVHAGVTSYAQRIIEARSRAFSLPRLEPTSRRAAHQQKQPP
jgi:hypothetical protein